jgi:parallel beta-helix repeat protein
MRDRLVLPAVILAVLGLAAPVSAGDKNKNHHAPRFVVDDDGQATVGSCTASAPAPTSIQSVVDAAPAGAIIYVCSGVYVEQVSIMKRLTLVGKAEGNEALPVVFPDGMVANAATIPGGAPIAAVIAVDQATGVEIRNITVDASRNGLAACDTARLVGILYSLASGSIERVSVSGARYGAGLETCPAGAGIFVQGVAYPGSDVEILHSVVRGSQFDGIRGNGGARVHVIGNVVDGAPAVQVAQAGIVIVGSSGIVKSNQVTNHFNSTCSLDGCESGPGFGIYVEEGGPRIKIDGNIVTNNQDGISVFTTAGVSITENSVAHSVVFGGAFLDPASTGRIEDNHFSFAPVGVFLEGSGLVEDNLFTSHEAAVVVIGGGSSVKENDVHVADVGIAVLSTVEDATRLRENTFVNVGLKKDVFTPEPLATSPSALAPGAAGATRSRPPRRP